MKKSRQRTSASKNTSTKTSSPVCTVINSSDLVRLWSAIRRVWPKVPLLKKVASTPYDDSVLPHFRPPPTTSTHGCVQLRLYWGGPLMQDLHYASVGGVAPGSQELWEVAIDFRAQNKERSVRSQRSSTKKASATSQIHSSTSR